jgi:hypothetical protein
MRRSRKGTSKRGWVVLGAAVLGAGVLASWVASSPVESEPSPATAVARRFPMAWSVLAPTPAPRNIAALRDPDEERRVLFSPDPVYPANLEAAYASAPSANPAAAIPEATSAVAKPAIAMRPRNSGRPGAVLNDTQIASIKERLHLTPEQERHWPALEAALRKLAWKKPPQVARRAAAQSAPPTVDPNSVDLERLKTAAAPLILSFSSEQKREVRALANIVGLEKLLAQF